ncbi:hypothetical protein [Flavimobilis soli]|nr:hypothetical protein [Flavimobilis soli]
MVRRTADVGYGTGDWFVVPLADGSFAPGRVVVHHGEQGVLGYLFAPQTTSPTLKDVSLLDPGDALLACKMSGLYIGSRWPLLGGAGPVDLSVWRLPEGENDVRRLSVRGREVRVDVIDRYLRTVHSFHVPLSELGQRQPGGSLGPLSVENWFPQALAHGTLVPLRTQRWWDHPTPVPEAAPMAPPREDLDDRVCIVVPGRKRSAVDVIECALLLELDSELGELDGTMSGPEGTEIVLYGQDGRGLAAEVERIVRAHKLPAGTHLLVEAGEDTWTVPLAP